MKRGLTQFAGPALAEVWLRAADDRLRLEWELLASILCDPREGLKLADQAGVTAGTFGEAELRLIYLATVICRAPGPTAPHPHLDAREAHRLHVYRLAKLALRDAGAWDPVSRQWLGPMWSDETLSLLFDGDFSPLLVPARARLLDELAARQRDAGDHLRYAWRILGGEAVA